MAIRQLCTYTHKFLELVCNGHSKRWSALPTHPNILIQKPIWSSKNLQNQILIRIDFWKSHILIQTNILLCYYINKFLEMIRSLQFLIRNEISLIQGKFDWGRSFFTCAARLAASSSAFFSRASLRASTFLKFSFSSLAFERASQNWWNTFR